MHDRSQNTFDRAEEIGDALHSLAGCEDALMAVLDEPLSQTPDKGRAAYGVLQAMRLFRAEAADAIEALALAHSETQGAA